MTKNLLREANLAKLHSFSTAPKIKYGVEIFVTTNMPWNWTKKW